MTALSPVYLDVQRIGVFVNIAVALIIDIIMVPLFFLEPFILYLQFYLSGKFFIESLKKLQ